MTLTFTSMTMADEGSALLWQDNSLSYLTGGHYRVDPRVQQTLTFEHASGWKAGDVFLFIDYTQFNGGRGNALYGEFSPRLSYSKLSGKKIESAWLKDVLLASTLEFGKGDLETLLLGVGLDFNVPGMNYFKINFTRRMPINSGDGEVFQLSPVWSVSLGEKWVFDGYIDWRLGSDGTFARNWHFNPQLKYDIGQDVGLGKNRLQVGVEYSYWHNKYAIADTPGFRTHQNTASLMLQAHF